MKKTKLFIDTIEADNNVLSRYAKELKVNMKRKTSEESSLLEQVIERLFTSGIHLNEEQVIKLASVSSENYNSIESVLLVAGMQRTINDSRFCSFEEVVKNIFSDVIIKDFIESDNAHEQLSNAYSTGADKEIIETLNYKAESAIKRVTFNLRSLLVVP